MQPQPPNNDQPSAPPRPTGPPWYHHVWRLARWPLIIYLGVMLMMMFLENKLIFIPSRYPTGDWQPAGLDYQDAWFQAADGTELHGWYLPRQKPRAVVLYCHGNAGNITHRTDVLRILQRRVGVAVLILDYRGYGRSQGKPDGQGVLADARAARAYLAEKEGIPQTDVVLLGRSLGGAVAVELAAEDGARALVLESSFSSLPDVGAYHYPWLPVRWLMRTRFDSAAKIGSYRGPLLQSHGRLDEIIPYRFGQRLHEAANQPKRFITFAGKRHNDLQPLSYYDELIAFLDGLPGGGEEPGEAKREE